MKNLFRIFLATTAFTAIVIAGGADATGSPVSSDGIAAIE